MNQIVTPPSQLGAVIQTHRLGKGPTQTELATLAGTQQKTISAIAGTRLDTLISVIAVLGLDLQIVPRQNGSISIEDVF